MDKTEIRKIFKKKRNLLTASQIKDKSQLITDNFIQNLLPEIVKFSDKKLAFYLPANNEVDTKYLINYAASNGNIIALPKADENKNLLFKQYKIGEELEKNILFPKLLEPKPESKNITPDIVFVPLVAFDNNCNRIGMGGGFYDIYISKLRFSAQNITFIGLGYDLQFYPNLPNDELDQNLDFIVSESKIFIRHQ